MVVQRPAPAGIDVTTPNVARMYDYYLGGKDNYAADRVAAEEVLTTVPEVRLAVRENRGFLGRAVRLLAESGVRQFLDIGTGLPTQNNVHEIAHQVASDIPVVYVDYDPVVVVHGEALLTGTDRTAVVCGDLRQLEDILANPTVRALVDFDQPVAILLVAILNFVTDDANPAAILARLRQVMAPGSYLVLSHGTQSRRPEAVDKIEEVYDRATAPVVLRSREEILPFFDGLELLEPGLVYAPQWRPDTLSGVDDRGTGMTLAGVARKP